jgi:hypothetical protein
LVGDEVDFAEGDPLARLLLFRFITDVEDDSHLEHKISLNAKGWHTNYRIVLLWQYPPT